MHTLTDPLAYEFMRHALIAATLVGGLCGLIGVYVVLRRMSYIGHGMSHAVFGGAVVGYVLGWNFYLVAGVWGFISALLINQVTRRRQIGADAAIGIVTTASFAFGVALISRASSFTRNFDAALFGNLLGISREDLYLIAITAPWRRGGLLPVLQAAAVRDLRPGGRADLRCADGAHRRRVRAGAGSDDHRLDQIMGVTLIAASLVIPPVVARLLTNSFAKIIVLSTAIGAATGFAGVYISYYEDLASGATIVLLGAGLFIAAMTYNIARQYLRMPGEAAERRRRIVPMPQDVDVG